MRAAVIVPVIKRGRSAGDGAARSPEARLEEARGLALAIGIVVADAFIIPVRTPRAATLLVEGLTVGGTA